jgi:hypothetical protein
MPKIVQGDPPSPPTPATQSGGRVRGARVRGARTRARILCSAGARVHLVRVPEKEDEMFARVQSAQLSPDDMETFISMIRDRVIPRARGIQGFTGGYWLADRSSGQVLSFTLFESRETLEASAASAAQIRREASRAAGLPEPSIQEFEVVASFDAADLRAA